tara:strand:- start:81 stop:185 length:105 start_codon:yes stop_codon:yes gene_type:complete
MATTNENTTVPAKRIKIFTSVILPSIIKVAYSKK